MTKLEQNQLLKAFEADIKGAFESKKGIVDFCTIWKIFRPFLKKIADNPSTSAWVRFLLNGAITILNGYCPG
ncbi:MAG TPA: hypothetical protein VFO76_04405 [Candidatus Kapabacteria bacterium]|nr:hypothetical protein [Candidatus Kapabacteria bacterium]